MKEKKPKGQQVKMRVCKRQYYGEEIDR